MNSLKSILLNEDKNKFLILNLNQVKNLVSYYQVISSKIKNSEDNNKIKF